MVKELLNYKVGVITCDLDLRDKKLCMKRYQLVVTVDDENVFRTDVFGGSGVGDIHIETDKVKYRAGETVEVRALSMTNERDFYSGDIKFGLKNPDGFTITTKNRTNLERFLPINFTLPQRARVGKWQITAQAEGRLEAQTFSVPFLVADYELPPLSLIMSSAETVLLNVYKLQIYANSAALLSSALSQRPFC
ncbi:unnamed protein product [Enterobius vermicularis]|uniref:MG2 domain-containing protein n=1 Tax=Enterobius vermicularis TaxID=51028 RepID=A0A0N4VH80_ENTVE|nr:unnamed protein product [Enterobius vermicularis]